jgi:non-heme chloroperoxidase
MNVATPVITTATLSVVDREKAEVERANATGRQPVIFIHGLWLLSSSWNRWLEVFEKAGYVGLAPGWPDDPETVAAANANPDPMAGKTIGQVADHIANFAGSLNRRPAIVGHSFGGLLAQILAGRGLSIATAAIDPAGFRGVLPLPFSALKSAFPVLGNPANRGRAVRLTYEQFRYAFANAVDEVEAKALYDTYAVPAPGAPLFQAAMANFNPWTEAKVDTKNPRRGPLLIVSGERDHTVPPAVAGAAFKKQKLNPGHTEFLEMKDRGHALTIDHGWREVADATLSFLQRFTA